MGHHKIAELQRVSREVLPLGSAALDLIEVVSNLDELEMIAPALSRLLLREILASRTRSSPSGVRT